jgi:hypothetical protein
MRRSSLVAALLAMVLAPAAQGYAQTTTRRVRPTATNAQSQTREQLYLKAVKEHPNRWIYKTPGGDPNLTRNEVRCGLAEAGAPDAISVDQVQNVAFRNGTHDKCTEPGLLPISKRLKRRIFQLLHTGPSGEVRHDVDNDPAFEKDFAAYMQGMGAAREETFGPGDTRLDLLEENGSVEPGHQSPAPPTPFDFTIHAWVTPAVPITDGLYAGRAIRFVSIAYTERDGVFLEPCFNDSGMFAEMPAPPPVQTQAAPPPPPQQQAPPAITPGSIATAVATANVNFPPEKHREEQVEKHHGHKGLIAGLIIGGAAGTAICLIHHHNGNHGVSQPAQGVPPESVKPPLPAPPVNRP